MRAVFIQGGRRYFSRRKITALEGGPGNMAVYHHILVTPPTAKVVTAKKRKLPTAKTIPPKKDRHISVLPLPSKEYRQL